MLISCVELNPGPPLTDYHTLEKLLDDLVIKVRAERANALQEKLALAEELKLFKADTAVGILALKTSIVDLGNRIATLECSLTAANVTIPELQATPAENTLMFATQPSTMTTPTSRKPSIGNISSVAGELQERSLQKKNAVIFGLVPTYQDNENNVQKIIVDEFHLPVNFQSVHRLGNGSYGPALILVKFASEAAASAAVRLAKNLHSSVNGAVHTFIFISPYYTKLKKHELYNLRVKQHHRTVAAKSNLIIRNGAVVTHCTLTAGAAIAPVAVSPAITSTDPIHLL